MLLLLLLLYVYFFLLPQDDPERLDKVLNLHYVLTSSLFPCRLALPPTPPPSSSPPPPFFPRHPSCPSTRCSSQCEQRKGQNSDVIVGAPQEDEQEDGRGKGKEKQTTGTGAERWASTPSKASTSSRTLRSRGSP